MNSTAKTILILAALVGMSLMAAWGIMQWQSGYDKAIRHLPDISFQLTDKKSYSLSDIPEGRKTLLVHFNPHCNLCQEEIKAIRDHHERLHNVEVVLASSQPPAELDTFVVREHISALPNIHVVYDLEWHMVRLFGAKTTPTSYIFNENRKLVRVFEGETPFEDILDALDV